MIRYCHALAAAAIDYELLWIGNDSTRASVGRFGDFHHSAAPVWRVVSGYLGASVRSSRVLLTSHGHPVGSIGFGAERGIVDLIGDTVDDGRVVNAAEAGLALVRDDAQPGLWGFTIVHGPSSEKVSNRLALLESLTAMGGRNA